MNGISVDTARRGSLEVVVVENSELYVEMLPALGGKIWQIRDRATMTDLLWHHPRIPPREVPFHSVYDDVFFGGWDQLFPNDEPEELAGERMPDHGEVWAQPWQWEIDAATGGEVTVHQWVSTPIYPCRLDSWVRLRRGQSRLSVSLRLENLGRRDLPYLWKQHVALPVMPGARILLDAEEVHVEEFGTPRTGRTGFRYAWPNAQGEDGTSHDMSAVLPPGSDVSEFQYALGLRSGTCALIGPDEQAGLALDFDPAVFGSCWTFASYGGWRELDVVVLEPCTGYPVSVSEGIRQGTHKTLAAGEVIETEVVARVVKGLWR